jgi:TolC family type I secretion outer membrane protein
MRKLGKRELVRWALNSLIFLFLVFPGVASSQDVSLPQPGKPLSLNDCVALALRFNPALRSNQATVEAQRARVEQALAAYYPQITFNANYATATSNFGTVAGTTVGFSRDRYSWAFTDLFSMGPTLNQLIYDFGRTSNNVKINRENVKANEQDLVTTKQNVILNVQQAYFGVLQTQRLVEVAKEVVSQAKQYLEQAQGFYQAGTRPKIDVTKAEVNVANAQLALIQTNNNFAVAQATLNNAIGFTQPISFPVEDILGFTPREIQLEDIVKTAFDQRPEIQQIKAKQRSQEAAIKLAQSSYYPILSGNASNLYRTNITPNDIVWDWSFGVTLSVPLFSGFSSPNQVSEQRANLKNLISQEETLRLNIRLEAEQAYLSQKQATEQVRVTEKAVGQAQENYDLASGRYQVGVGSPLEITDAEVQLANAKANYIQALYNLKVAEARIEKAMGVNK